MAKKGKALRGFLVPVVWEHDPCLYAPPRYRRACRYDAFVPERVEGINPLMPAEVAAVVAEAEAGIVELNGLAQRSRTFDPLVRLLLRTESIASSKIEGLQVDVRGLARAEATQDGGRPIGRDVEEVLGNIDAMAFAVEQVAGAPRVEVTDVCNVHEVLMQRSPMPSIGGRVRDRQNWVGGNDYNPCGADFVPPPPEHVRPLLEDLCAFIAEDHLSPLVHAAIAHAQFETIHPFADGNGRTGRALLHVVLRRRGLASHFVPPISVALAARRSSYIEGLTAFREDDLAEWLELFSTAAIEAVRVSRRYADEVSALQDRWREMVRARRSVRADAAIWAVIDVLPGCPVLTVAIAAAATRRTKPAVNEAVAELVDIGVLVPLTQGRRNRAWEAAGLLDLVTELEAGPVR